MGAVTAGGPGVVALGNGPSTALAWTSTDGRAWNVAPPSAALGGGEIRDMTSMGSRIVAVGRKGTAGASWTSAMG